MVHKCATATFGRRSVMVASSAAMCVAFATLGAEGQPAGRDSDCLRQLLEGRGSQIVCELPTRLTARERDDLRAVLRDPELDATCKISIRIARNLVEDAIRATGPHVFTAPPQPVTCEFVSRRGKVPIKAQFSPRIMFDSGKAVDGTPGLEQVSGASSPLAWPVIQYVNRSGVTRETMLKVINALKEQHGKKITSGR